MLSDCTVCRAIDALRVYSRCCAFLETLGADGRVCLWLTMPCALPALVGFRDETENWWAWWSTTAEAAADYVILFDQRGTPNYYGSDACLQEMEHCKSNPDEIQSIYVGSMMDAGSSAVEIAAYIEAIVKSGGSGSESTPLLGPNNEDDAARKRRKKKEKAARQKAAKAAKAAGGSSDADAGNAAAPASAHVARP